MKLLSGTIKSRNMTRAIAPLATLALLAACATAQPIPTPTPTPLPSCEANVCIRNVYLQIVDADTLLIQFDLVDQDFEVSFGESPQLESRIAFALFLVQPSEEDIYLAGMEPDLDLYVCYAGNDFPWSDGRLAAACGLAIPLSILQVRPSEGDPIRVEIIRPEFNRYAVWLPSD